MYTKSHHTAYLNGYLILGKGMTSAWMLEAVCVYKRQDLDRCRRRGTPATTWQPITTAQGCLTHSPLQLFRRSMPSLMTLRPVRDQGAR